MRKSKVETAQTRERIVSSASAMFREDGLANVSVVDLMANAGLTHGGFYAHFASRDELVAEAIRYALAQSARRIYRSELKNGSKPGYSRLIQRYLSREHRDNPQSGCVMASVGSELARTEGEARSVYSTDFEKLVTLLAELSPARTRIARRSHFLSVISSLVGALTLARAVQDSDASEEILASVRQALLRGERSRNARNASSKNKLASAQERRQ